MHITIQKFEIICRKCLILYTQMVERTGIFESSSWIQIDKKNNKLYKGFEK